MAAKNAFSPLPFARAMKCSFLLLLLGACSVEIVHDLDEPQANAIVAVLQRHGVAVEKTRRESGRTATYTVQVRRADAPRAWQLLRERNLPRPATAGLGDVFKAGSLVPTAAQQRALMRHALAGEITRTLQSIDGVQQARVHIVLPRRDPLAPRDQQSRGSRASVLLKITRPEVVAADDIRRLVAGAVEGLAAKDVSVVLLGAATADKKAETGVATVPVGPFAVAASSRGGLVATLLAGIALILLLGLGVLVLALRLRRARRSSAAAAPSPALEASMGLIERSFDRSRMTRSPRP